MGGNRQMKSPELPTTEEAKAIERMIDTDIYFLEHEGLREVPILTEGLGE